MRPRGPKNDVCEAAPVLLSVGFHWMKIGDPIAVSVGATVCVYVCAICTAAA
jgi:hypothetical protein